MLGDSEENNRSLSLVGTLTVALLNERSAPDLLPFQAELVTDVKAQIQEQDELLSGIEDVFTRNLFRMDIERIQFCLRSYLRTRLLKVQAYSTYFAQLSTEGAEHNMSEEEARFAKELVAARAAHLTASFLDALPPQHRTLDKPEMIPQPDPNKFVFVMAVQDVGTVRIDNDETFVLDQDDIYLTRYAPMQSLVQSGQVRLI